MAGWPRYKESINKASEYRPPIRVFTRSKITIRMPSDSTLVFSSDSVGVLLLIFPATVVKEGVSEVFVVKIEKFEEDAVEVLCSSATFSPISLFV